jgi:pimeloyl-ACP methyl ester carboxylesterase
LRNPAGRKIVAAGSSVQVAWAGRSIEVRELGAGPCLVLVHGYPLDGAMWSGVARALSTRFRVVKLDLPGHGELRAEAPRSLAEHASFVRAVLSGAAGPAALAGFSMGGYVALELLRDPPENLRAAALVDTRAEPDDEEGRRKRDEGIASLEKDGVGPVAESMPARMLAPASLANADLLARLRRVISRQSPETLAADLAAMRDRRDSRDFLATVRIPTLVVVGEEDAITPPESAERLAGAIPGARLVRIAGAGHLAPMERPGAVAAALGEFFAEPLALASPGPDS